MHIACKIIDLLSTLGPEASSCPSDVARALIDDEMAWWAMMPATRGGSRLGTLGSHRHHTRRSAD